MSPFSAESILPLITEKTKCVIFAYLYGIRYDIAPFVEILKDKNIDILEDVA
jgi:dTDP-4-amino-4,6-dideoxygalactose transaminase